MQADPLDSTAELLVASEASEETVPCSSLIRIIECDLSQRQDTVGNPHGEHAHSVWRVLHPNQE